MLSENTLKRAGGQSPERGFAAQVGPVFFLAAIFLLNFIARIILSPLLPTMERELAISHKQAGLLFLLISAGYLTGLLSSGFLSSRSTHRRTILVSSTGVGVALLFVSLTTDMRAMQGGLLVLGLASGFYMPSAIATITALFDRRHWGKAIAIHELAPNLAFFSVPSSPNRFSIGAAGAPPWDFSVSRRYRLVRFIVAGAAAVNSPVSRQSPARSAN